MDTDAIVFVIVLSNMCIELQYIYQANFIFIDPII